MKVPPYSLLPVNFLPAQPGTGHLWPNVNKIGVLLSTISTVRLGGHIYAPPSGAVYEKTAGAKPSSPAFVVLYTCYLADIYYICILSIK